MYRLPEILAPCVLQLVLETDKATDYNTLIQNITTNQERVLVFISLQAYKAEDKGLVVEDIK